MQDESILQFVEQALYLIPLGPRGQDFHVLENTCITRSGAQALSDAAESCWNSILDGDIRAFGQQFRLGFEAQVAMFPNMMNHTLAQMIAQYHDQALGWKVSGAGGGGYLIWSQITPSKTGCGWSFAEKTINILFINVCSAFFGFLIYNMNSGIFQARPLC